jgi:hypothetical protein
LEIFKAIEIVLGFNLISFHFDQLTSIDQFELFDSCPNNCWAFSSLKLTTIMNWDFWMAKNCMMPMQMIISESQTKTHTAQVVGRKTQQAMQMATTDKWFK